MVGFSRQNLYRIPWGHNALLVEKLKDPILRLWYARKTLEHGWSRAILTYHIERNLHVREGNALTNFQQTLPPAQSDLAQQALKDPYNFDFLTLRTDAHERDLEKGLLDRLLGSFLISRYS
jgi:predicted nuclease of restriction endonuclease-like (RecB) superfamily